MNKNIALNLMAKMLDDDDVKWIVNDNSELGVMIGERCFFLYKGYSYCGGDKYREVFKREFGECCHPWETIKSKTGEYRLPENYIGFLGEDDKEWKDIKRDNPKVEG
jgi:hypothetical protein